MDSDGDEFCDSGNDCSSGLWLEEVLIIYLSILYKVSVIFLNQNKGFNFSINSCLLMDLGPTVKSLVQSWILCSFSIISSGFVTSKENCIK